MIPSTLVETLASATLSMDTDTSPGFGAEGRLVPVSYSVFNHRLDGHLGSQVIRPIRAELATPATSLM